MDDLDNQTSVSDTMEVKDEPKSSSVVLSAIQDAKKTFETYNNFCKKIDDVLSARTQLVGAVVAGGFSDQQYDLFWASMEILKPAIYAKPPRIVVSPKFNDGDRTDKTVAELMERVLNSEFERSDIDQVMLDMRDDLAITNRGVDWITYENEDGEKRVCIEHLDRFDFLHEPARKWTEVSWVARCAYMTRKQMADRFRKYSGLKYQDAALSCNRYDKDNGASDNSMKAEVWEVWSRSDNRVYWVSEGVDVFLDEDKPHLDLKKGFPCPRPAYGTKQRRSLIPVPDYTRYESILEQINEATLKIYALLEQIRMFGLIPGGGDVGNAIQAALNSSQTSAFQLIPVPSAQFAGAGAGGLAVWWPIEVIAQTITGLIQARQQLFDDFYQLSGISDIMRGATEADETLGAQRLKGQYGSVRIKDKTDELVRVARDTACIAAEIICDNFDQDTLLEISQMTIPTKSEVEKKLKDLEASGKEELANLMDQAEQARQQIPPDADPQMLQQAEKEFKEAQQAILAKYSPQIKKLSEAVVIEDVMEIIKDRRTRGLIIDVETDSTVMIDEMAEKQSRSEFLNAFSSAAASVQALMMGGEAGAKLGGGILKFSLQPYRANRELDSLIDDFVEQAPQMAGSAEGDAGTAELAAAQKALAEAEGVKAQAAMASVQARAAQAQADNERKMAEMQMKAQESAARLQQENDKLQLQLADLQSKDSKTQAEIDKLRADTAKILASIGLDVRKQELSEYTAAKNAQQSEVDTALKVQSEGRAERGEERADRQQQVSEQTTDRQMTFQERQAETQGTE